MNRTRNILRAFFLLLAVVLLFYLNNKTGVNLDTITRFKVDTFNKIQVDSLDSKDKLDLLVKETKKFSGQIGEDASHARETIYYLISVLVLFIVSELIFLGIKRKDLASKNQN